MIGWNSGYTAVTLPDGTPVSSGEGGGVKVGGGGAYQSQFTNHMYLPVEQMAPAPAPAPGVAPPPPGAVPPPPALERVAIVLRAAAANGWGEAPA